MNLRISQIIVFSLLFNYAHAGTDNGSTVPNADRGWHWYEIEPDEEEIVKPKVAPPPPSTSEQVTINVKWLRDNLPRLLDKAQDNPSRENIAAYYYAQRVAADKASGFAEGAKEFFMFESALQESNRRPNEQTTIMAHKDITSLNQNESLKAIFQKAGLWMFYASDCPYCHKQFPMLETLARIKNANILAISINGISLELQYPGVAHVIDYGHEVTRRFDISLTPTLFLVTNDGANFHPISQGLMSGSEIIDRVLVAGRNLGLITKDEFIESKEVRSYSTTAKPIMADKKQLEDEPAYLADLLRKRLKGVNASTVTKFKEYDETN